ncbi:MAG: 50S ribosomal protein L5 [Elusimicrobiota bacterium]
MTEAPRLKRRYFEQVGPEIMKDAGLGNLFEVPRLMKIVVNMGVSEAKENIQALDSARDDLGQIVGQLPQVRRAKKSISNFKLREGMPIGLRVTLRGDRMYEFLDRLVSTAVPRIRDFRGLEPKGFDGMGNYNLGLREHHIFSEIDLEKSPKARGMNITFVTTAVTDKDALEFLGRMGMPFKKRAASAGGQEAGKG